MELEAVRRALPAYEVRGELGRGAFGIVLDGTQRSLDRRVAIKQLPAAFAADPKVRRRFDDEAQLLASLDHRHIVRVYDYVEQDGLCLLVMEHLDGGTLWQRMADDPPSWTDACRIALSASAALAYAHDRGVLHRDIKPENLMFTSDGVLKVTDFGLAKVLGGTRSALTADGHAIGTPTYMSPEQAAGRPLGPATDVYSLATVLYELLAEELPFGDVDEPLAALYQRVHAQPVPLADRRPDLPGPVTALVDRALVADPAARVADASSFATGLRAALVESGELRVDDALAEASLPPAAARTLPPPLPVPTPAHGGDAGGKRRRALVAGAALAVGALGIGAVVLSGDDGEPAAGGGDPGAGFTIEPAAGPVGTPLVVTSTDACPDAPAGWTGDPVAYVQLHDPRSVAETVDGVVVAASVDLDADGGWSAVLDVPATATTGPDTVRVQCAATDPDGNFNPYHDYPGAGADFEVTAP